MSDAYSPSPPFEERFAPEPPPGPGPQRNWLPGCLVGCLIGFLVSLCLCGGGVVWVLRNIKPLAAEAIRAAVVNGVNQSELDDAEKLAIIAQIDRVVDQFKAGQIDNAGVQRIFEELSKSPLMGTLILYGIEKKYLDQSGLNAEERAGARQTLQRVLRGVYQKQLDPGELKPALDPICTTDANGDQRLKERITDQELRNFLDACRAKADQAGVPDEPFTIRASEEFRKAIDRALAPRPEAGPE